MKKEISVHDLFNISQFQYADLFEGSMYPWEALSKIESFIAAQFKNRRITCNFGTNGTVFLGEKSQVQDAAMIQGSAIIGKNTVIGHASLIRGNCIIGDDVHIGHGVEIKNSIVLNGAHIAHLNYIGDSIIGNGVNVSGGAMLANFRLDKKPVSVRMREEIISTGLLKCGAFIGDNSIIGVNAVLNPGTILGKNTIVYPLVCVRGVHKNGETIKER